MGEQVSIMYAVTNGYVDDVPQDKIRDFEIAFHRYMRTSHSDVINAIMEKKELSFMLVQVVTHLILHYMMQQKRIMSSSALTVVLSLKVVMSASGRRALRTNLKFMVIYM